MNLTEAYTIIRNWYKANLSKIENRQNEEYFQKSKRLIEFLPDAASLSDLEMRVMLGEVIYGYLEWGYHESDGNLKMSEYAKAAFETLGISYQLSDEEKERFRSSPLWEYSFFNR